MSRRSPFRPAVSATSPVSTLVRDDPVMLIRCQNVFPATGEVLSPYTIGPIVPGSMRGSHQVPMMPVKHNSSVSYFDGPPVVACYGFVQLKAA